MKVIKVSDDQSLHWDDVPDLVVKPDEILINVHAAAVNRADLLQRVGKYPPPPGAPPWIGLEIAGVVVEVGAAVTDPRWKKGDPVCALLPGGGYAQQVSVQPELLLPLPEGLTMAQAASLPEAFATAWLNLVTEAQLKAGETVFIHAGASGVGIAAIQIAHHLKARVITSVGGQTKTQAIQSLGAERIIDHHQTNAGTVFDELHKTDHPINVVLDCVGGPHLGNHLAKLALGGRWVLIATLGGPATELNLRAVLTRRLRLIGSTLRSRTLKEKEQIIAQLTQQIWPQIQARRIYPVVYKTLPIEHADQAHQILQRRENIGKVVLIVRD